MIRPSRIFSMAFLFVAILLSSCIAASAKKPVLKNTLWVQKEEMFVADVGTMTITRTIEFVSATEVHTTSEFLMPSHAAMYMNEDGTVDRIPGSRSEDYKKGTYKVRKNKVTLYMEDGDTIELLYEVGLLIYNQPSDSTIVYLKQ